MGLQKSYEDVNMWSERGHIERWCSLFVCIWRSRLWSTLKLVFI